MDDWSYKIKNSLEKLHLQLIHEQLKNHADYDIFQQAISEISELVDNAKNNYNKLANKLSKPSTGSKTYWSIIKTFCNNKKISLIPPIFIGKKYESGFKLKTNHFQKFFASKCRPTKYDSSLPSFFEFYSKSRLSSLLLKIISWRLWEFLISTKLMVMMKYQ